MSNSWFTPSTWALARSNVEPIVSSKKNEAQHRIYEVKHLKHKILWCGSWLKKYHFMFQSIQVMPIPFLLT